MSNKFDIIKFNSFNCRGLCDKTKENHIFSWLRHSHAGITLVQETHSTVDDENIWQTEWGNDIIFSHGTSVIRGVAILIPKNIKIDLNILSTKIHRDGFP